MTEDFIQENEDRELFRRIKQGSEEAFRVVYGKYHRILYAVALKMLKDRSAAENAVQHVFVKLWIGRQEMTVMLSLRNYLYTMTRNYILNYLRSRNILICKNLCQVRYCGRIGREPIIVQQL